ncbi:MAG: polysaccharide deacetylase family protein [Candidatus Omnitrophica bacterium]|nr:polysaccharide deacetylase family protein [Candidatus Omnitrophota bacterium]
MRRDVGALFRVMQHVLSSSVVSRCLLKDAVVVFLYHEVSDQPSAFNRLFDLNVRPAIFAKQLDLIRGAFHVIDPRQLLSGDYRTPAALVTFDDGNLSYFRNALPMLKEKRIPSVAFLNMGPIRGAVCWSGLVTYLQHCEPGFYETRSRRPTGNDFCRFTEEEVARYLESVDAEALFERVRAFRGPVASEEDLDAADDEPLVSFGNHLYNHYNATLLSDRLEAEYWNNQRLLDQRSRGMRLWSYPFSCSSEATTRWLLAEGTRAIFTGAGGLNVRGHGPIFHRIELPETVVTEREMMLRIVKDGVSAAWRRVR